MDLMYVKYSHGKRISFIKNGSNILISNIRLCNTNNISHINSDKSTHLDCYKNNNNLEIGKIPFKTNSVFINSNVINFNSYSLLKELSINEQITNYFFNSVHENYLNNK